MMIWGGAGRDVIRGVCQRPLVAAWYCSTTLAGMRPRALTAMPWSCAHARISPLRILVGCGPPRPAALSPGPAGVIDERCEIAAERRGVLGAQIDLILGAIHPEPHPSICRAPIKIILEFDGYLLCHPGLLAALSYLHQDQL